MIILNENSIKKCYYNYIVVDGVKYVDPLFVLKDLGKNYFQTLIDDPMQRVSVKGDDVFVELSALISLLRLEMMPQLVEEFNQTEAIKLLSPILSRLALLNEKEN